MKIAFIVVALFASMAQAQNLKENSINRVLLIGDITAEYIKTKGQKATIEATKTTLTENFKDPGSAQFRNLRVVKFQTGKLVCGEVNAKNSYGAYVGFKPFVGGPIKAILLETSEYSAIDEDANAGLYAACGK